MPDNNIVVMKSTISIEINTHVCTSRIGLCNQSSQRNGQTVHVLVGNGQWDISGIVPKTRWTGFGWLIGVTPRATKHRTLSWCMAQNCFNLCPTIQSLHQTKLLLLAFNGLICFVLERLRMRTECIAVLLARNKCEIAGRRLTLMAR